MGGGRGPARRVNFAGIEAAAGRMPGGGWSTTRSRSISRVPPTFNSSTTGFRGAVGSSPSSTASCCREGRALVGLTEGGGGAHLLTRGATNGSVTGRITT